MGVAHIWWSNSFIWRSCGRKSGEGVPFTSQLLNLQRDPAQLGTKSDSRRGFATVAFKTGVCLSRAEFTAGPKGGMFTTSNKGLMKNQWTFE